MDTFKYINIADFKETEPISASRKFKKLGQTVQAGFEILGWNCLEEHSVSYGYYSTFKKHFAEIYVHLNYEFPILLHTRCQLDAPKGDVVSRRNEYFKAGHSQLSSKGKEQYLSTFAEAGLRSRMQLSKGSAPKEFVMKKEPASDSPVHFSSIILPEAKRLVCHLYAQLGYPSEMQFQIDSLEGRDSRRFLYNATEEEEQVIKPKLSEISKEIKEHPLFGLI